MAQARDEAGNIWDVTDPNNPVLVQQVQPSGRQASIFQDPYAGSAEIRREQDQQFEAERLRIAQGGEVRAEAAAERAAREWNAAHNPDGTPRPEAAPENPDRVPQIKSLLEGVSRLRELAEERAAVGSWSETFKDWPVLGQNRQNIEGLIEQIEGDLIQQQIAVLSAINGGSGVATMANSETEARRIAASIANLNPRQEKSEFLTGVKRAEDFYLRQAARASGLEVDDPELLVEFLPENNPRRMEVASPSTPPNEFSSEVPEGLTGRTTDESPSLTNIPSELGGTYQDSLLGQGISGVNEGMAGLLGLPVDAAAFGMNLVPQGLNAIANTDIPTIESPALGSDWWRDQMQGWGIYDPTDDPAAQFTRRVGESIGASAIPIGAAANTGRQAIAGLLAASGGGIGGATAQQVAPGNLGAEIAGELLGSAIPGVGLTRMGQRLAQREIESAIPTTQELRGQAGDLYRQAELQGQTASPQMTQQLRDDMMSVLRDEGRVSPTGRISEVYPKAREAIQMADDYAGSPMSPTQVQTVRTVVADGLMSQDASERRIARLLTDTFDDWAAQSVPGLDKARDVSSRYLTAEQLQQARSTAAANAGQFSGSGFENALRTQYRNLDRNVIRGRNRFSDELTGAVENVSRGTPGSNFARGLGRMAPTGVVSGGIATGVPFAIGNAMGGPALGGALSAATLGTGIAGRSVATNMGIRNADIAELIARGGGPIEQAPLVSEDAGRLIAAILAGQAPGALEDE